MEDVKCMLSITINGQLLLLMFAEKVIEAGGIVDMCNTDGITIRYPEALKLTIDGICEWWSKLSKMEVERVKYLKVVRMNINNYMAIYEEKGKQGIKQKGLFLTEPPIDQSSDLLVIAKALEAYFVKGTPIEEFIRTHDNIYDFCCCQKVDKSYDVYWNGQKQQKLNRYYISETGPYLYKSKKGSMDHMMKGWSVQLFNNYFEVPMKDYRINYDYYVSETKKLLNELQPMQTKLFE